MKRPIAAVALAVGLAGGAARADLPPPDGMTRVWYQFRIEGVPEDTALVAFPEHDSSRRDSHVLTLQAGKDNVSVKGYPPGLYALSPADAAALVGLDDNAAKSLLAAKAQPCLKAVPRVYQVPTTTKVERMVDVLRVTRTSAGCSTQLVTTHYAGKGGIEGDGGVDAAGHRLPPAPFGRDLPGVVDSGLSLDPAAAPPAWATPPDQTGAASPQSGMPPSEAGRGGCAGCMEAPVSSGGVPALLVALGLALGLGRRRGG
jgi:hypothetical protein